MQLLPAATKPIHIFYLFIKEDTRKGFFSLFRKSLIPSLQARGQVCASHACQHARQHTGKHTTVTASYTMITSIPATSLRQSMMGCRSCILISHSMHVVKALHHTNIQIFTKAAFRGKACSDSSASHAQNFTKFSVLLISHSMHVFKALHCIINHLKIQTNRQTYCVSVLQQQ